MADGDPRVPGHRTMVDDEEEQMPFFSQFSSAGGNLGRGMGGNPEYLDMLIELFQGVAVDGSSAYVPLDKDEEEYDVADDGNEQSSMSTTSKKRGSIGDEQSASSPGKKHKSPMMKLMTGFINTINSDNTSDMITEYANKRQEAKDKAREKKSNNTKESITHCQDDDSSVDGISSDVGSISDDEALMLFMHQKRKRRMMQMACMIGMYHLNSYCNK
ncbi:hypothetical protein D1007_47090 [Hordeum vulgare]|nr:hypothetical protein D1007_47090 [Hordeum vulgare]